MPRKDEKKQNTTIEIKKTKVANQNKLCKNNTLVVMLIQNADTCVVWVGGISHSELGLAKLEMFVLDGNNQITQESVNNKKEKQTEK